MTAPDNQPDQPTPDDSRPAQTKGEGQGTDGVTPDDSAPPQDAQGDGAHAA